jgi:hypothetical protein
MVVTAYILYLPFFVGFDSQAGGIVPSFMYPTRGAQLWVMWAVLFIPLFAYLIFLLGRKTPANWRAGILLALGLVLVLFLLMFAVGWLALALRPDIVNSVLDSQGRNVGKFIADSMARRGLYIGGLLTLLALLIPTLSLLFVDESHPQQEWEDGERAFTLPPSTFTLLLIALGVLLILGPDFFYLRDNFGYRINTIFKFYYQAWTLLSLAAAFGVAVMFTQLRGWALALYTTVMVIVIGAGLVYPAFALPTKTDDFKWRNPEQRTLDGSAYLAGFMPDDYQAIQFMQGLEPGVVAEATSDRANYSEYARISTFTGMPTVLGWPGHEDQWRAHALQGSRMPDLETLYTTSDWNIAMEIIDRYDIRYIVVGDLERRTYDVNEEKFINFLTPIYQNGSITVYEVPKFATAEQAE